MSWVHLIDGYTLLSVAAYQDVTFSFIMDPVTPSEHTFTAPRFTDGTRSDIDLWNPTSPQRTTFFKVVDHESEPIENFVKITVTADTIGTVIASFGPFIS